MNQQERDQMDRAQLQIETLTTELMETQRGLTALTFELEERVAERTASLRESNQKLKEEVAEREKAEEEVRRLNEELELRVDRRTHELEAANRDLDSFAYSVSHDLRAPLRSIDGFSLALLEDCSDKIDDMGKDYLHRIRRSAQRMAQLIDDLLQLSRIVRRELTRQPVNLSRETREILCHLQEQNPERKVELFIEEGLTDEADPTLIRVVLQNILENAWKYTSKATQARIELRKENHEDRPMYVIRDNGAGFSMAYVDKLFVPFQRLHSDDEFEGTGIGLAIVRRAIHRHGGTVSASGKIGEGACFRFTLGPSVSDVGGAQCE